MLKKCPHCHHEYEETSRFCPYCGAPNTNNQKPQPVIQVKLARIVALFVVGFIGFEIIATLIQIPFLLVARNNYGSNTDLIKTYLESAPVSMFVNSISYCVVFVILLFLASPIIPYLWKSFKNKKSYAAGLVAVAAIFAFNLIYSIFLVLVGADVSNNDNQTSLDSIVRVYPLICLVVFGVFGPICEELTYRVGLFETMRQRNRILAYAVTIVIFTFIHFNFTADNLVNEILNIPYYASAAFAFTFVYDKYGFAASVSAHVLNNMVSMIQEILR